MAKFLDSGTWRRRYFERTAPTDEELAANRLI